jgi:glyoxylase-like metal-dependent hydrolase (beta-lactamase superfamily II)
LEVAIMREAAILVLTFVILWLSQVSYAADDGFISPGVYKKTLGNLEIYALADSQGRLDFSIMQGISKDQVRAMLGQNPEMDNSSLTSYINAFLVKCPAGLILVDTGLSGAKLLAGVEQAGFKAQDVTDVLLTHFHGDHINGLIDGSKPLFPKATIWADKQEDTYWLKDGAQNRGQNADSKISPYKRLGGYKTFSPGDEIKPGITAVELYGHTPGHTGFVFQSGGEKSFLAWGDVVHAYLIQFARPEVTMTYDVDSAEAAKTRALILKKSAETGYLVGGAHLPFPGLGQVKTQDSAYVWEKEK